MRLCIGLLIVCLLTLTLPVCASPKPQSTHGKLRPLFRAMKMVETGKRTSNFPRGDQGRSRGPYQIQYGYWKESGVAGRYEDVENADYAERVMIGYWHKYCPKALERGDWQTLAKVHNGGPGGPTCKLTVPYWKKVKSYL